MGFEYLNLVVQSSEDLHIYVILLQACRSIAPGQSGFISNDHDAKVSYVSNQFPDHPEVFSMMRQACVRSLSCEVCNDCNIHSTIVSAVFTSQLSALALSGRGQSLDVRI